MLYSLSQIIEKAGVCVIIKRGSNTPYEGDVTDSTGIDRA